MKAALQKIPVVPSMYRKLRSAYRNVSYLRDYREFQRQSRVGAYGAEKGRFPLRWSDRWPCINDSHKALAFEPHYLYHPAWAARVLAQTRPQRHVDISSTLAFVTMVSAFVPVDYYEWRPPKLTLSNLTTGHADLLALPFADGSVKSLSCMHTIEHVGLGRYGDPIDPDGDLKAIDELKRVLALGGDLLFVVPLGRAKIRFNAHRVYSYEQVRSYFPELKLMEFSLILEDASGLVSDPPQELVDAQDEGCGCFWFRKTPKA